MIYIFNIGLSISSGAKHDQMDEFWSDSNWMTFVCSLACSCQNFGFFYQAVIFWRWNKEAARMLESDVSKFKWRFWSPRRLLMGSGPSGKVFRIFQTLNPVIMGWFWSSLRVQNGTVQIIRISPFN